MAMKACTCSSFKPMSLRKTSNSSLGSSMGDVGEKQKDFLSFCTWCWSCAVRGDKSLCNGYVSWVWKVKKEIEKRDQHIYSGFSNGSLC